MSRFVFPSICLEAMTNILTRRVWDLASGEVKSTLQGHTECVTSVAISPDGLTIVSGSNDKTVR